MLSRRFVTVSAEILKATRNGDPVVALESTIITHGMPYPKNLEMSLKVEKIIRDKVCIIQRTKHCREQTCVYLPCVRAYSHYAYS